MSAFPYGVGLQWRLDLRSKALLITCYVVPLLFFAVMGGIFTAVNPTAKDTLIQSMTIMGVVMGAIIGLPPTLAEIYGGEIRKMYQANGVPLYLGLVSTVLSAFLHLLLMSGIIYLAAPALFDAAIPKKPALYFGALAIFIAVSLSLGGVLGLAVKSQAKLTMVSQLFFLPSIMLSGIMFPADLLPKTFRAVSRLVPATWGYAAMADGGFSWGNLWPLAATLAVGAAVCGILLKRLQANT